MAGSRSHTNTGEGVGGASVPQESFDSMQTGILLKKLEMKRKQLDEEIERFRAQKEQEFRDYEMELRETLKREGECPRSGPSQTQNANAIQNSMADWDDDEGGAEWVEDVGTKPIKEETSPNSERHVRWGTDTSIEIPGNEDRATQSATNGVKSKAHMPRLENSTPPAHDREREFRGVFTPSFLPLLASFDSQRSPQRSMRSPNGDEDPFASTDIPVLSPKVDSTPMTKPSLRKERKNSLNPGKKSQSQSPKTESPNKSPQTPQTPKSALKSSSEHHSRRNSKSPKRVYFQLANAVVHPTSSYEEDVSQTDFIDAVSRLTTSSPHALGHDHGIDIDESERRSHQPQLRHKDKRLHHSRHHERMSSNDPTDPSSVIRPKPPPAITLHSNNSDVSMLDLSGGGLLSPGGTTPRSPKILSEEELSESMGNGIFQFEDDLEDGGAGGRGKYGRNEEEDVANKQEKRTDDDDFYFDPQPRPNSRRVDPPISASPHAGSLPIDIVRPPRPREENREQ